MNVQTWAKHKTLPFRCRDYRRRFNTKTGTPMQSSNLRYQTCLYASYLLSTNLKNLSSIKLHRNWRFPQTSAWHLAQRIRHSWNLDTEEPFEGPVEADETYMGVKRKNIPKAKRAK